MGWDGGDEGESEVGLEGGIERERGSVWEKGDYSVEKGCTVK